MRRFLILFLAMCATLAEAVSDKMNVVFILIDDLGHHGISAYGNAKIGMLQQPGGFEEQLVETPRIDSLAEDGAIMERAYTYPLCEPTRIALMSGVTNLRNYHKPKSQHSSDITFGDLFQHNDYETCLVGKWKQTRGGKDYVSKFGWDEHCAFDVITEGYRMIDPDIVENGKVMNYKGIDPITGRRYYGPDIFNRYALDFIERNQDKPFFLWYSMVLMHDEHTPTPDTQPHSIFDNHDITKPSEYGFMKGDDRRYFPDMLRYADKMVGNVLDKLDELNLRDNTLVIVMGDNGTKECFYHVLEDGTKVLGDKGSMKEGGTHIPLLMRAPGKIAPKTSYDGLVSVVDILPTMCDSVGIEPLNKDNLDGKSFWDQVTGKTDKEHRDWVYLWYNANNTSDDLENVIECAFNKDFKRYAPSTLYPEGRFFDLRTDLYEVAHHGDVEKKKVPKVWNKWHYSGLDLSKLDREQKAAYKELGKVLEQKDYVPVKSIEVRKSELPLAVGQTQQLECRVSPENATRKGLVWVSSDPKVATVNKFGEVTALKKGAVTITAYSWDDSIPLADGGKEKMKTDGIQSSTSFLIQ